MCKHTGLVAFKVHALVSITGWIWFWVKLLETALTSIGLLITLHTTRVLLAEKPQNEHAARGNAVVNPSLAPRKFTSTYTGCGP